jgi:hypothetical protein
VETTGPFHTGKIAAATPAEQLVPVQGRSSERPPPVAGETEPLPAIALR